MPGPEVMLAASKTEVIKGDDWWYEVKWDGIRAVVTISPAGVMITSRRQADITTRYRNVVEQVQGLPSCVLDGEIVVADSNGRPDFGQVLIKGARATFVPFDLLELDGRDLRQLPYVERHAELNVAIGAAGRRVPVSIASQDVTTMWSFVVDRQLEGLVAKRGSSRYRPGRRHSDWVKLKSTQRVSVIVTGIVPIEGRHGSVGAFTIALYEDGVLTPIGKVGSGISQKDAKLAQQLIKKGEGLIAEVECLSKVSGHLRMPVFRGFRFDVDPSDCTTDQLDP